LPHLRDRITLPARHKPASLSLGVPARLRSTTEYLLCTGIEHANFSEIGLDSSTLLSRVQENRENILKKVHFMNDQFFLIKQQKKNP
jgi:hypothetical protein